MGVLSACRKNGNFLLGIVLGAALVFLSGCTAGRSKPSQNNISKADCIHVAAEETNRIKALPARAYLHTLDGQKVSLKAFFAACHAMFPACGLFDRFYYWPSEVKVVASTTPAGTIQHKIRSYSNFLSTYCPSTGDLRKPHGDVAEFYDQKGIFMGLAVYMGQGKYFSLPHGEYRK